MRTSLIRGSIIVLIFLISVSVLYGQEPLFPEIPNWRLTQSDPVYDANNLWDIIDGAADLYLEYAFVNLHIARYVNADSIEVKVELYRHSTEADAFGIYSQERDPKYNFIDIGVQGYLQQGVLNFLDGVYYVKLSTYQTGDKAQEAMKRIAQRIDDSLKQKNSWPDVMQLFPALGKLANAEQYVAKNFLGYSFLNTAYVATYKDSTVFKIFIIQTESSKNAERITTEYLKAVPKESITELDDNTYEIHDAHVGVIELRRVHRYVYGSINCTNPKTRNYCLKQVTSALPR
jgi:hypothetical protein